MAVGEETNIVKNYHWTKVSTGDLTTVRIGFLGGAKRGDRNNEGRPATTDLGSFERIGSRQIRNQNAQGRFD